MRHLNFNQKLLVFLIFVVFITANVITLIIALPKFEFAKNTNLKVDTYNTSGEKVKTNKLDYKTQHNFFDGNIAASEKDKFRLFSNTPASFQYDNSANVLTINRGIIYLKINSEVKLSIEGQLVLLPADFDGIFNSSGQTLTIISGELNEGSIKVQENQILYWFSNSFEVERFDRSNFSNDPSLKSLLDFTKKQNSLASKLDDLVPPNLLITSHENNFESQTFELEIEGITEKDANLRINSKEVDIASRGNFTYELELEEGENIINFEAEDSSGNINYQTRTFFYFGEVNEADISN